MTLSAGRKQSEAQRVIAYGVKSLSKLSPIWSAPLRVDRMGDLN